MFVADVAARYVRRKEAVAISNRSPRFRRLGVLAVLLFGAALLGFGVLRVIETKAVYPRPLPEVDFPHPGSELLTITDAERSVVAHALFVQAEAGYPTVVAFHGNGEQLENLVAWLGTLKQHGLGALAVEYPG